MNKVIVINNGIQYLGSVLNTEGVLNISDANLENVRYLQEILARILKKGVSIMMSKQTQKGHIVYPQEVQKTDPAYLEGIQDGLKAEGLTAYLLKPAQAKLWRLMHQAGLPKEIRNKISYYMQDIPEEIMAEMIQLLEEKAGGYQEALRELVQKIEQKSKQIYTQQIN